MIRIVFFGTSEFALSALNKLHEQKEVQIVLVVTKPDRPSGRGLKLESSPIKKRADELGLEISQPEKVRDILDMIKETEPDLFVLAAYGKLIPEEALLMPKHGSLNIHPSLLPELRGPSPIQSAILEGKKETGVTIMEMVAEMDAGPIVAQEKSTIGENETGTELHDRLSALGADLLVRVLPDYIRDWVQVTKQDDSRATFTKLFKNEDYELNLQDSPEKNLLKIRAFADSPGAFVFENGKRKKIFAAKIESGQLVPTEIQYEGKKRTKV